MRLVSRGMLLIIAVFGPAVGVVSRNDRYGAIAYSPSSGAYGYSYDDATRAAAEATALEECGKNGKGCKSALWFKNACGGLAIGKDSWASERGDDKQTAERKSLESCKARTSDCSLVGAICATH